MARIQSIKLNDHKDISVHLDIAPSSEAVMYCLRENWAAVGVLWNRVSLSDFQVLPYRSHALVAVMPKEHALEGTPEIKFTDLYLHDVAGHRSSLEEEHALRRSKVIPEQPLK